MKLVYYSKTSKGNTLSPLQCYCSHLRLVIWALNEVFRRGSGVNDTHSGFCEVLKVVNGLCLTSRSRFMMLVATLDP